MSENSATAPSPSVLRVGIDAQSVQDVHDSHTEFGDRYLERLFTSREIEDCGARLRARVSAPGLAARFAAKEATLKALQVSDRIPTWTEMEVVRGAGGFVSLRLTGLAAELAAADGLTQFQLSLTHTSDIAMAVVVAA